MKMAMRQDMMHVLEPILAIPGRECGLRCRGGVDVKTDRKVVFDV
jgi:hypothetical protein